MVISALLGIYLLSGGVVGWFFGRAGWPARILLIAGALGMLDAGLFSDLIGLAIAVALFIWQKRIVTAESLAHGKD